ncbi:MAG: hypothetical protein KAH12_04625 [Anaerolineales bacterium]|nr:hypothetical protein [Anaerolineales bacterium]
MPILAVGSVAYDTVNTPFGKTEDALGGSASYFGVTAGFFSKVCLVACVGGDFRGTDRFFLESRNIDLKGLEVVPEGKTFRWEGNYSGDMNVAETLDTQLNVFADFNPIIPDSYRRCEYVFLGNIDPVLQRRVLEQVNSPRLVVCDTMNFWIEGKFEALLETLKYVDVLIINDAETKQLASENNLVKAVRKILKWGPSVVVVKRGEYGAAMFTTDATKQLEIFAAPAYPQEKFVDPTGAGDSFAGGFVGYLAGAGCTDRESMRQAVVFGSVVASFNIEKFSLDRLRDLTFTEIRLRYNEFYKMMSFEGFEGFQD